MSLEILPLAITMMAGPQIVSAIVLVTHKKAIQVSLAFLAGVAVAATIGVAAARGLAAPLASNVAFGDASDPTSTGTILQLALVGLLLFFAVKNYLNRETIEPPKWLGALLSATPRQAAKTGLLLILLMPSGIVVMLIVGVNLQQNNASFGAALPFLATTVLIAALPLLGFLLFRRRAERVMPQVRDWMNSHSWLINIIVCGIFIVLILSG